jgi:hypothetical protein
MGRDGHSRTGVNLLGAEEDGQFAVRYNKFRREVLTRDASSDRHGA